MALKDIIDKIRKDTADQVSNIRSDAQKEADKLLKEAEERGSKEADAILKKGKADAAHRLHRMEQVASVQARKGLLATKQEVMGEVFATALERLSNIPDKEYAELLKKMVVDAAVTGDEEVLLHASDVTRLGKGWITAVNSALTGTGKKGGLKFSSDNLEEKGGFVLKRGKVKINSTFVSLLKSCRDRLEPKIAKVLF
ncbi:MAG: V-type ATP synthase subunit E family protein [Nitrospinota bacterium]|nr:hypothetical protein [Nitrospinota bacterium]